MYTFILVIKNDFLLYYIIIYIIIMKYLLIFLTILSVYCVNAQNLQNNTITNQCDNNLYTKYDSNNILFIRIALSVYIAYKNLALFVYIFFITAIIIAIQ